MLIERGYEATAIHLADCISLSNEITIKHIAEGLDRALPEEAGLSADEPFDAIVHSTAGLVIREWLATYGARRRRLKRLVALAPATFGSPLAHKGQSWLAAVFKGERQLGPDFMETGHLVPAGPGAGEQLHVGPKRTGTCCATSRSTTSLRTVRIRSSSSASATTAGSSGSWWATPAPTGPSAGRGPG